MKRILFVFLFAFCVMGALFADDANPKYVFLFIGDGMSTPQRMMAEEFARKVGHGELLINHFPSHATTRTVSANSLVTDSAAAGTALACGEKTNNGRIGMSVDGSRRLESVAEVAHQNGKKVGIVTSVTINHATPASFYAHRPSRSQYYGIGLDLIDSNFEYFGGGGFGGYADNTKSSAYRGNLYELAEKAGYKVVSDPEAFHALKPGDGKVLARGCEQALPYTIDGETDVPTLEDFTRKGIELLDNPNGFFMMIEGGSIDWCGHANEAATNLMEVLALDKAVRAALEFAQKHPDETLIVVTGDHETGGMTMGFAGTGYALYVDRLAKQKCSIGRFGELLKKARSAKENFDFDDACAMLTKYFGFEFSGDGPMKISDSELKTLREAFEQDKLPDAARRVMNAKAGVGWTSGAHTALPVLTTSYGKKADVFTGFIDNTDIANRLKTLVK